MSKTTIRAVTKNLKIMYARYSVPDTVITDNGPQFMAQEFYSFAKVWGFVHKTPHFCK